MNASFPILKLLSKLLVIVALFIITVVVINTSLFDETLDPDIARSIKPVTMPNKQDNAYYSLMGFTASSDKNMNIAGQQLASRNQQNITQRAMDNLTEADYQEILGHRNQDEQWMDLIANCVARKSIHCSSILAESLFSENNSTTNQLINSSRVTLLKQRFLQLSKMMEYKQTQEKTFSSPLPSYAEIMKISQLNLAEAYYSDDFEVFLSKISPDLQFWRLMLLEGNSLIDKMIAVVRIWGNLHTISEYISKMDIITSQQRLAINELLTPLSQQEIDISEAFIWEQTYFYSTLKNTATNNLATIYELPIQPTLSLLQVNATMNDYNQFFTKKIVALGQLNTTNFYQKITQDNECCFKEIESLVNLSPASLYNLGGKSILAITVYNPEDYIARVHDLNGMFQLVKLKLSLKDTDNSKLSNAIENSNTVNQYTGEPLNYRAQDNRLGFDCLNKHSLCEVEI